MLYMLLNMNLINAFLTKSKNSAVLYFFIFFSYGKDTNHLIIHWNAEWEHLLTGFVNKIAKMARFQANKNISVHEPPADVCQGFWVKIQTKWRNPIHWFFNHLESASSANLSSGASALMPPAINLEQSPGACQGTHRLALCWETKM